MHKIYRFVKNVAIALIPVVMFSGCGNSEQVSENPNQGFNCLVSSGLWESVKGWGLFPSTSSSHTFWIFVLLAIASTVFLVKRINRIITAVVVAIIGICQIYFFLCYYGNPVEISVSVISSISLTVALTLQLLVTDRIAIDHSLEGDYYARKNHGILGIASGLYVILFPILYYVFIVFIGWSFMEWVLKIVELWFLALICNLVYGAVSDRLDETDSEPKAYYITAAIISIGGFLITVSYNPIPGYISSIVVIVVLIRQYIESYNAGVRIKKAAEAEEIMKIQKGADSGDPWDICRLGEKYWSGKGVEKDYNKAFELFSKAAKLGNKVAYWDLARCYDHGWGAPFNPQKAVELYKEAYQRGVNEACYSLGRIYEKQEYGLCNNTESFNWFLKGAQGGDVDAQFRVADCYEKGIGTIKDIKTAMSWWKTAADNGHDFSSYHYGAYMYEHGYQQEGLAYLRKAKEGGSNLAKDYMNHYNLR